MTLSVWISLTCEAYSWWVVVGKRAKGPSLQEWLNQQLEECYKLQIPAEKEEKPHISVLAARYFPTIRAGLHFSLLSCDFTVMSMFHTQPHAAHCNEEKAGIFPFCLKGSLKSALFVYAAMTTRLQASTLLQATAPIVQVMPQKISSTSHQQEINDTIDLCLESTLLISLNTLWWWSLIKDTGLCVCFMAV